MIRPTPELVLRDCHDRTLADVRALLGPRADWPKPEIVKDKALLRDLKHDPAWSFCWVCGRKPGRGVILQLHHWAPRGRSDVRTNLMPVCFDLNSAFDCHPWATSFRAELLYVRHLREPESVDWEVLTRLFGRYLPEPVAVELNGSTLAHWRKARKE
jgi:hypothetical protein